MTAGSELSRWGCETVILKSSKVEDSVANLNRNMGKLEMVKAKNSKSKRIKKISEVIKENQDTMFFLRKKIKKKLISIKDN